jgi:hypothetical protein
MREAGRARDRRSLALPFLLCLVARGLFTGAAVAADEIQVYNAEINDPGVLSLQLHGNYVPRGRTSAGYPGGMTPEGAYNGTPELAWGVADFFEVGAYLPYGVTEGGGARWGGAKLRALLATPHARDRRWFCGVNFEVGWQPRLFERDRWNAEIRPILGWRGHSLELIVNPIVDVPLSGPDRKADLAPAARAAAILSPAWSVGVEHYADLGRASDIAPRRAQLHETFAVADYSRGTFDLDFGVGRGLTSASDDWTVKFIAGWTFTPRPSH